MSCLVDSMRFFIKCLLVMFKEVEGLRKCSVGHVRQCCIIYMSKENLLLVSGHYKLVIILASLVAMYGYVAEPDNS